jgi:hypothetical protein
VMAILSALGIAVALLMARHHQRRPKAVDLAAAAAATSACAHSNASHSCRRTPGGSRVAAAGRARAG